MDPPVSQCSVGVVEGRAELSFAVQKTRRVASRLGIRAHARRGVGAEVGMEVAAEGVGVLGTEVGDGGGLEADGGGRNLARRCAVGFGAGHCVDLDNKTAAGVSPATVL